MRRVHRGDLSLAARRELRHRASLCTNSDEAREEWNRYRRAAPARPVIDELKRMAGTRGRCFYCSDSRASDVEHFVPIALDHEQAFRWRNMLWICTPCNRKKLQRPPTVDGTRVLIDPSLDDPWKHLVLDVASGFLAPRYLGDGAVDVRGEVTLEVLDILNYEALSEGRRRTVRRLGAAAEAVVNAGGSTASFQALVREVQEDEYGVSSWFACWEGSADPPFSTLAQMTRPWRRFVCASARQT